MDVKEQKKSRLWQWIAGIIAVFLFMVFMVEKGAENRAQKSDTIAVIGNTKVVSKDIMIEAMYQNAISNGRLGNDMFKNEFFMNLLAQQVIYKTMIVKEAEKSGIMISDDVANKKIAKIPMFVDTSGSFDYTRFIEYIDGGGIKERDFIRHVKNQIIYEYYIRGILPNDLKISSDLALSYFNLLNDTRKIDVLEIKIDKLDLESGPNEYDLQRVINDHRDVFLSPEIRHCEIIQVKDPHDDVKIEKIEDMVNSGRDFKSICNDTGCIYKNIIIDVSGKLQNSNDKFGKDFSNKLFELKKGVLPNMIQDGDVGYFVNVIKIDLPSMYSFEKSKPTALKLWKKDVKRKKAMDLAKNIVIELKYKKNIQDISFKHKIGYSQKNVKFNDNTKISNLVFMSDDDSWQIVEDNDSIYMVKIIEHKKTKPNAVQLKKAFSDLEKIINTDIISMYMGVLARQYVKATKMAAPGKQ